MPDIDLGPESYKSDRKPWRLMNRRTAKRWLLPLLGGLALTTYAAINTNTWWSPFLPWAPLLTIGAIIGYVWPDFFFDED